MWVCLEKLNLQGIEICIIFYHYLFNLFYLLLLLLSAWWLNTLMLCMSASYNLFWQKEWLETSVSYLKVVKLANLAIAEWKSGQICHVTSDEKFQYERQAYPTTYCK